MARRRDDVGVVQVCLSALFAVTLSHACVEGYRAYETFSAKDLNALSEMMMTQVRVPSCFYSVADALSAFPRAVSLSPRSSPPPRDDNARSDAVHPLSRAQGVRFADLAPFAVTYASGVTALAILVTASPFRAPTALMRHLARAIAALIVLPLTLRARLRRRASALGDDAGDGADGRSSLMTPELERLVTDDDVRYFLDELAAHPTLHDREERSVREPRSRANSEERGVSSVDVTMSGGWKGAPGGVEAAAAAVSADAAAEEEAAWTVIHRGSTGTGTDYRMLRRNGPAPGTSEGGDRGLAQFRLEAVVRGVTAESLANAQMNDVVRATWDSTLMHADQLASSRPAPLAAPSENSFVEEAECQSEGADAAHDRTELAFWRMKFPMPMAPRDYLFVRRRWKSEDGAFYGVTKDATGVREANRMLQRTGLSGRGYRVRRIFSGQRIRPLDSARDASWSDDDASAPSTPTTVPTTPVAASATSSPASSGFNAVSPPRPRARSKSSGKNEPAAELVSVYHEDSGVPAAVISIGACKGLQPFMRKLEKAARGEMNGGGAGAGANNIRGRKLLRFRRLRKRITSKAWDGVSLDYRNSHIAISSDEESTGETAGAHRGSRFRFRHRTRMALSRLKNGLHRTIHRAPPGAHGNGTLNHAEGRRRRLMVRAAAFVALMQKIKD